MCAKCGSIIGAMGVQGGDIDPSFGSGRSQECLFGEVSSGRVTLEGWQRFELRRT